MRNLYLNAILLAALTMIFVQDAWAGGFRADTAAACNFMAEQGLRTRGGYRVSGDIHRCTSQRRNLISGGQLNNSIRFLAQGDAEKVTRLTLELRVNSRTGIQLTHRHLVDYARSLMMNALGVEMSEEIEAAILGAITGSWEAGDGLVTLERIVLNAPTYELRFRIQ